MREDVLNIKEIMNEEKFNVDKTASAKCLATDILACKTGICDIDCQLQVFKPGEITVLAGRPAMGKTTVAMNIYQHIVKNERTRAAYVGGPCSMEKITGMEKFIVRQNIGILIIDFVQIIHGQDMALDDIMSELRAMANRFGISILLCSQLLRSVECRPNHIPTLVDLDPVVANNAHNIILIFRESYYSPDKPLDANKTILDEMKYIIARDSNNIDKRKE